MDYRIGDTLRAMAFREILYSLLNDLSLWEIIDDIDYWNLALKSRSCLGTGIANLKNVGNWIMVMVGYLIRSTRQLVSGHVTDINSAITTRICEPCRQLNEGWLLQLSKTYLQYINMCQYQNN